MFTNSTYIAQSQTHAESSADPRREVIAELVATQTTEEQFNSNWKTIGKARFKELLKKAIHGALDRFVTNQILDLIAAQLPKPFEVRFDYEKLAQNTPTKRVDPSTEVIDIHMKLVETPYGQKQIQFRTANGKLLPPGTYHGRITDVLVEKRS